jgi:hypothetical protein
MLDIKTGTACILLRPFASNKLKTASLLNAEVPIPYTVSVGNATIPPLSRISSALSKQYSVVDLRIRVFTAASDDNGE